MRFPAACPGLANKVWGLGFIAVVIALVNSGIAGSNASSTATTRVGYAMGRIGLLPRVFTQVNERYKTPTRAVHVQALFAMAYLVILGFALHGPLNALVLQGAISTILIVAIYILTCVSCLVYYLRALASACSATSWSGTGPGSRRPGASSPRRHPPSGRPPKDAGAPASRFAVPEPEAARRRRRRARTAGRS